MNRTAKVHKADVKLASPHGRSSIALRLRSGVMAGLVLVIPIWFTFVVVTFVFRLMRDASLWLIEAAFLSRFGEPILSSWGLQPQQYADLGIDGLPLPIQWGISAISVVLTIASLYVLGAVTTNVVGKRIIRLGEQVMDRIPFVTVIYQASKKVLETFAGDGARPFQQVVLVPFPNQTTSSIGFVTRVTKDERTNAKLYTVFVPTAPNPTTGFVFVIDPSQVSELNWTAEEAIKVVMSGGVLMPDHLPRPLATAAVNETATPGE